MNLLYTLHLQSGSRHADVQALQAVLNRIGDGGSTVNGFFGRATQEAILCFQQQHGLPASGLVDEG